MIAALICVVSVAAFLQFFVSYCRSILASTGKVELSESVREVTGIENAGVAADDFARLLQLLHLCSGSGQNGTEIRAIGTYYGLLRILSRISRSIIPSVSSWVERERRSCSYFAAVALDRRISNSRDMFNRQFDSGF
ncbi:MAG: hypothetical protein ACLQMT_01495 [Candidatus Acidiferrales bacterium]